jgi:hypothetical protein
MLSSGLPQTGHKRARIMTGKHSYSRRNAEAIFAGVVSAWEAQVLEGSNKQRGAANGGTCLTAAAVATTLVGAAVARADDDDRHWKRKRHHHSPPHYIAVPPVT